jgi:hypothetical protein
MKQHHFPPAAQLPAVKDLPDPFVGPDGKRIASPDQWEEQREYLKAMVSHYMYGEFPQLSEPVRAQTIESKTCMDGQAVEELVRIFYVYGKEFHFDVRIIRPHREGRFPAIVYNNFWQGEHAPKAAMHPEVLHEAVAVRGYVFAEFDREEISPDLTVHLPPEGAAFPELPCGAILAWAWGHSMVNDYLLTCPYVNPKALACTGGSRGGKTALAAGIFDERIAVTIAIASGCGGDGCLRFIGTKDLVLQNEELCETLGRATYTYPYWFLPEIADFGDTAPPNKISGRESRLPFDSHTLRALVAPRPLLSTLGADDAWCNIYGVHIAWRAAQQVYDFLGVPQNNMLHVREGGHVYSPDDWTSLLDACDHYFLGKPLGPKINKPSFDMDKLPRHFDWEAPR